MNGHVSHTQKNTSTTTYLFTREYIKDITTAITDDGNNHDLDNVAKITFFKTNWTFIKEQVL